MKILIADDSHLNRKYIDKVISAYNFEVLFAEDGDQALDIIYSKQPEIVLLDFIMPKRDGVNICKQASDDIRAGKLAYCFFILMTSNEDIESLEYAVDSGINLFITKPINPRILKKYIEIGVRDIGNVNFFQKNAKRKEFEIKSKIYKNIAKFAELIDDTTGKHVERLAYYSKKLALDLGKDIDFVYNIGQSAPLHDIGKIAIDKNITQKPGKLTDEEFAIMKTHTTIGYNLLKDMEGMEMAANIAHCHHENWNGTGYPNRLKGDDIPLEAQIVSIVDVYDALRQKRPYKNNWNDVDTLAFIKESSGIKFNPEIVDIFLTKSTGQYNDIYERFE